MSYAMNMAVDSWRIKEQEYAIKKKPWIRFDTFTSCVGIVIRTGENLSGFHLVENGRDYAGHEGAKFDANAEVKILGLIQGELGRSVDEVTLIGAWCYFEQGMPEQRFQGGVNVYPAVLPNRNFVSLIGSLQTMLASGNIVRDTKHIEGKFSAKTYGNGIIIEEYKG